MKFLFAPENQNVVKIGVWVFISLLITLTVGIGGLISMAINAIIVCTILGIIAAAVEGAIALRMKRPNGWLIYRRNMKRQFSTACIGALLYLVKYVSVQTIIADIALTAVTVPTLMIGFTLGSLLWTKRSEVFHAAVDVAAGRADASAIAKGALGTVRDATVKGVHSASEQAATLVRGSKTTT